jgi:hypothetical protein
MRSSKALENSMRGVAAFALWVMGYGLTRIGSMYFDLESGRKARLAALIIEFVLEI